MIHKFGKHLNKSCQAASMKDILLIFVMILATSVKKLHYLLDTNGGQTKPYGC